MRRPSPPPIPRRKERDSRDANDDSVPEAEDKSSKVKAHISKEKLDMGEKSAIVRNMMQQMRKEKQILG